MIWMDQEDITSSTYSPYALWVDPEAKGEKISIYPHRQIVTDDYFCDIQPLATVRSALPSDIESVLPSTSEGFVLRTWFTGEQGAMTSGLYALPSGAPVTYTVFYNPDSPSYGGKLNIIHRAKFNASTYKTTSFCYHQDTSTHDWHTTRHVGLPTGGVIEDTYLDVTSWSSALSYTRIRTVQRASLSPSGALGAPATISVTREVLGALSSTLSRLMEETKIDGSISRTTKYGYYDDPLDLENFGRLKWKTYPDGNFEYYYYLFNPITYIGYVYKSTPFKGYSWDPSMGYPVASNCVIETTMSRADASDIETKIGGQIIAHKAQSWSLIGGCKAFTESDYYDDVSGHYLKAITCYYPESVGGGERIKWRELPDGTAETYSYSSTDGWITWTQTVEKGAGDRNGITEGIRTTSKRNKHGYLIEESKYYIHGTDTPLQLDMWVADAFDYFNRPTKRIWNGDTSDFDETVFGCCGVASYRDRKGIVTETFQDDLKRVYKQMVTAGSRVLTTETTYNGLVTEVRRKSGSLDLLVSKTWLRPTGEIEKTQEPDQNNDSSPEETTYAYSYPSAGGEIITITHPDGGTEIAEYFADGSLKSVTGTAVAPEVYDYGVHGENGNGLYTTVTKPTSASPSGEWKKFYHDRIGRTFKIEYPTKIASSAVFDNSAITFYGPSDTAGSRGKRHQVTDSDGVAIIYAYDGEGNVESITEPMPGSAGDRVTTIGHDAVAAGGSLGNCLRTTQSVNGVAVGVQFESGDGYKSQRTSLGRVTTIARSIGVGGDWTEIVTNPDGTHTCNAYDDGILQVVEQRDSTGGGGNVISSTTYTYDAVGRMETATNSRTGTVTYGPFSASGNILGVSEGGRDTLYGYDSMGRRISVNLTHGSADEITYTSYYLDGSVKAVWGGLAYTTLRFYDEQRRLTELRTYRAIDEETDPEEWADPSDSTAWSYHSQRGWQTEKRDSADKGADYAYTAAGRLKSRTWARGAHTRYDYGAGRLTAVKYFTSAGSDTGSNAGNDSLTQDLGYTYDAFGRTTSVTRGGSTHFTYTYDPDELYLATETQNDTLFEQRLLTRKRDSILRPSGYLLGTASDPDAISEITHAYDAAGRLSTVTYQRIPGAPTPPAAETFTYGYNYTEILPYHVPSSGSGSSPSFIPFSVTGPAYTAKRSYDYTRDALLSIANETSGSTLRSSYTYTVNDIGQRTELVQGGSAFGGSPDTLDWGYDAKGQVTTTDSANGSTDDRYYNYDQIGNRVQSRTGTHTVTGGTATGYFADASATTAGANGLNQYEAITKGGATRELDYDDDGNLTDDGDKWDYTWDGENRLVAATPKVPSASNKILYRYDYLGRLFATLEYHWNATTSAWGYSHAWRHFYDGWNRIETWVDWTQFRSEYVWGLDLSGTLRGAGGVGGMLLWNSTYDYAATWKNHYPCYDGNGNVTELLDSSGAVAAHWEYDAFGNTTKSTPWTNWEEPVNRFEYRFSTKPIDWSTGLYYYGNRFYGSSTGKWLSRDPLDPNWETGEYNDSGFVLNDPLNKGDYLGLQQFGTTSLDNPEGVQAVKSLEKSQKALRTVTKIRPIPEPPVPAPKPPKIPSPEEMRRMADLLRKLSPRPIPVPPLDMGSDTDTDTDTHNDSDTDASPTNGKPSRQSQKARATNAPSWCLGYRPEEDESCDDFASRLLNDKYGQGVWGKGADSEFSKIKKWCERSLKK